MAMKYFVSNLQAALFTIGVDLSNKIGLADSIAKGTKGIFNGESMVLPLPPDAPGEIPRIILKSRDQAYTLNVGQSRFDFHYNVQPSAGNLPSNELSQLKPDYLTKLSSIVDTLVSEIGLKIVRLGFIATLQSKTSESSSKLIAKSFLKSGAVTTDVYDINLGILKRVDFKVGKVNVWFRINSFRKDEDILDDKIISTQFDINTLPTVIFKGNTESIKEFMTSAINYVVTKESEYNLASSIKK